MNSTDKRAFARILGLLLKTYGKEIDNDVVSIWWAALDDVSLEAFEQAATIHIKTSRFAPTPADIRDAAGANRGNYPEPEEAWNKLPKSEYDGGWVCDEMMAGFAACADSLARGDMIAARMAFLERYRSVIRNKKGKPQWWLSRPIGMTENQTAHWEEQMLLEKPESHAGELALGQIQVARGSLEAPRALSGELARLCRPE